jgi:geranylgeranyl pyrophosphate synthase
VAQGKITPGMHELIVMAARLKAELPQMLAEHEQIRTALERLGQAATKDGRPQVAYFAAKLLHHARLEEEVLYPAAIVLGEYLKSRLAPPRAQPSNEKS